MEAHLLNKTSMFYTKIGTVFLMVRGEDVAEDVRSDNRPCVDSCASRVDVACDNGDCIRTRRSCQISDCDSVVARCRPHRTKKLWKRYVKVFAALCILLLVEGLSPQTTAAPQRLSRRKMERTKRDSIEDNPLWTNPCDYKNSEDYPVVERNNSAEYNRRIATLARNVRNTALVYSHNFSVLYHSYNTFEELEREWEGYEWLRNYTWFDDRVLPVKKKFNERMPDEYVQQILEHKHEVLPIQYKALTMVVAALDAMRRDQFYEDQTSHLKPKVTQTMHGVREILCGYKGLMKFLELPIYPIESSQIPHIEGPEIMVLVLRDTLNMLHYIEQLFEAMSNVSTT